MILEAFAEFLHAADPGLRAPDVLSHWLWLKLTKAPVSNVDRVLHCEMSICAARTTSNSHVGESELQHAPELQYGHQSGDTTYTFKGTSESGKRLLKSLYEYCCSYEQQKWARWVHKLKASDFNGKPPDTAH